jgi:hypothetical protein
MIHQARDQREILRFFLEGRDTPCPSCRYNLRNCISSRCPECGGALRLDIAGSRPTGVVWLLPLVISAMSAGFALTVLGIAYYGLAWSAGHERRMAMLGKSDWTVLQLLGCAVVVNAMLMLTILHWRRRIESFRRLWRLSFAFLVAVALIAAHVVVVNHILFTLSLYY